MSVTYMVKLSGLKTNKSKTDYLYVGIIGIALSVFIAIIWFKSYENSTMQWPLQALQDIDVQQAVPVSKDMWRLNPIREKTGIALIGKDWKIVPSKLHVTHSSWNVLLNATNKPVKVILIGEHSSMKEYDVVDEKKIVKAAHWQNDDLFLVETIKDGKRNGLTIYYSKEAEKVSECRFVDDKPWTGRILERQGFDHIIWDVTYKDAKLDGEEKRFSLNGAPESLKRFKNGVPHGLQQNFREGKLYSEELFENGIIRSRKTWHPNGQREWEEFFTADGKMDGIRRMWNKSGELELEDGWRNGKEHGRHWSKGHQDYWFFNGKGLAASSQGEQEFKKKRIEE